MPVPTVVTITNQAVRRVLLDSVWLEALQLNLNSAVLHHTRTFFVRCDNFADRLVVTLCDTVASHSDVIPAQAGI
jgi:hypothetical protein